MKIGKAVTKKEAMRNKIEFAEAMDRFVSGLSEYVSANDGQWTVKGFIDIYKTIYTISSDTKIISKIMEIHLFPKILQFAEDNGYSIVLAEHQNWYPDFSFIKKDNQAVKFAVDLKTTYRDPDFPGHVNGFTLGSHGAYFKDRSSSKNIQFPYAEYLGHLCLGILYTRADSKDLDKTEVIRVKELEEERNTKTTMEVSRHPCGEPSLNRICCEGFSVLCVREVEVSIRPARLRKYCKHRVNHMDRRYSDRKWRFRQTG